MDVSARSILTAGVAGVAASAIAFTPVIVPKPEDVAIPARPVAMPPVQLLAASDLVNAVYIPIRDGISYGVSVAQAVIAPIPFGFLINDQINIIYPQIIAVTDSIVFDLIDPVVDNPLNLANYVNGVVDVGVSTGFALYNVAAGEVNYIVGFPLLPPLAPTLANNVMASSNINAIPPIAKAALAPLKAAEKAVTDGIDLGTEVFKVATGDAVGAVDLATDAVGTAVDDIPGVGDVAKVAQQVSETARQTIPYAVGQAADDNAGIAKAVVNVPRKLALGVVKGGVRVTGGLEKAATDIAGAQGDPAATAKAFANAPNTIAKGALDGLRKVAKGAERAAKGVQKAVGNTGNAD
jgi:hypothetical protein